MERGRIEIGINPLPAMSDAEQGKRDQMLERLEQDILKAGLEVDESRDWAAGFFLQLSHLPEGDVQRLVTSLREILQTEDAERRATFFEEWKSEVGSAMEKYGRPNE